MHSVMIAKKKNTTDNAASFIDFKRAQECARRISKSMKNVGITVAECGRRPSKNYMQMTIIHHYLLINYIQKKRIHFQANTLQHALVLSKAIQSILLEIDEIFLCSTHDCLQRLKILSHYIFKG
jgi:hypothetical protein